MSIADGRQLVEWDWLYNSAGTRLHHATLTDDQYAEIGDSSQLEEESIRLTCGRILYWPSIPGVSSRMSMARCRRCCTRLGYPQGAGSPKNDPLVAPLARARLADAGVL